MKRKGKEIWGKSIKEMIWGEIKEDEWREDEWGDEPREDEQRENERRGDDKYLFY